MRCTPRRMICDTGVSSAWQEHHPAGERATAFRHQTCRSYRPGMLPAQVHAGVTDAVAGRPTVAHAPGERSRATCCTIEVVAEHRGGARSWGRRMAKASSRRVRRRSARSMRPTTRAPPPPGRWPPCRPRTRWWRRGPAHHDRDTRADEHRDPADGGREQGRGGRRGGTIAAHRPASPPRRTATFFIRSMNCGEGWVIWPS